MRHLLTTILTFHWTAVFGLLALVTVLGGDSGMAGVLSMLGVGYSDAAAQLPLLSTLFSFAFTMVAVLFLWAFVTAFFNVGTDGGETTEVFGIAFAAAALTMTAVVLAGALFDVSGLLPVAAAHLAALLVSYLAIFAERWAMVLSTAPSQNDIGAAARVMALGAAHSTMLARLSGRAGAMPRESR